MKKSRLCLRSHPPLVRERTLQFQPAGSRFVPRMSRLVQLRMNLQPTPAPPTTTVREPTVTSPQGFASADEGCHRPAASTAEATRTAPSVLRSQTMRPWRFPLHGFAKRGPGGHRLGPPLRPPRPAPASRSPVTRPAGDQGEGWRCRPAVCSNPRTNAVGLRLPARRLTGSRSPHFVPFSGTTVLPPRR
jgi:hypothetical protein